MSVDVVIKRDLEIIVIYADYDPLLVRIIKTIPGRRWIKEDKAWVCPIEFLFIVEARLEPFDPWYIDSDPQSVAKVESTSWPDAMFRALKPAVRSKAYQALARALHPDLGGDEQAMQLLNASWDTYKKEARQ